jgi:hypothetical protein
MWATNSHLGEMVYVCGHARDRWTERGEGDLGVSVREAIPFGVQYGEGCLLLAHEEMVFVTQKRGAHRTIVTCMTKEQALINMQKVGVRVKIPLRPAAVLDEKTPDRTLLPMPVASAESARENVLAMAKANETANRLLQQFNSKVSDEWLADAELSIPALRHLINPKLKTRINVLMNTIQRERGMRSDVNRYKAHAMLMERQQSALRLACKQLLSPEQYEAVQTRKQEIEAIMGDDLGKPGWHEVLAEREHRLTMSASSAQ